MALIDELKKSVQRNKDIAALFRLDVPGGSGLILVMKNANKRKSDRASKAVFDIFKRYPTRMQLEVTDLEELKKDSLVIERITREAELISGEMPEVTLKQLGLKPFVIINYNLTNLSQNRKMQLKRDLYGKKTAKKYKDKTYMSEKEGALSQAKGRKLGRGSIIIPQQARNNIISLLRKHNVFFEAMDVWL